MEGIYRKTYRRLFALLMTLVMLLGMVPVASAELAGSFDTVGCSHKPVSWQWSKEPSKSCEEYARQERRCTICCQLLETQEERGAHKWTTRVVEDATCTERGYKETICKVCGDEKNGPEPVPAKGHDWGSWYWLGSQPSCLEGSCAIASAATHRRTAGGITAATTGACGKSTGNRLAPSPARA